MKSSLENIQGQITDISRTIAQNSAHNIFPYPYLLTQDVSEGVTFTSNPDGTVTVEWSEEAGYTARAIVVNTVYLSAGSYILSGCPEGGSLWNTYIMDALAGEENLGYDDGNGLHFELLTDTLITVRIVAYNHYEASASVKIFKPMIRLASDASTVYVKYAMTNRELTEKIEKHTFDTPVTITLSDYIAPYDGYLYLYAKYGGNDVIVARINNVLVSAMSQVGQSDERMIFIRKGMSLRVDSASIDASAVFYGLI